MSVFPPLVDLIRDYNTNLAAGTSIFDDDVELSDVPTAEDVARLFKRAVDARKRVKKQYSYSKARQVEVLKHMKHFETYGKASCRMLCQRISNSLPRELRDMIYTHLLEDSPRDVPVHHSPEPTASSTAPHYWSKEYVSEAMLGELLQSWYAVVRVHIGLDIGFLEDFLAATVPYVNVPRSQLVRNISVTIDHRDVPSCYMAGFNDHVKALLVPQNTILTRLNHLTQLSPGASMHIYAYHRRSRVYIQGEDLVLYRESLLGNLAKQLFERVCQWKKMGYSVGVGVKDGTRGSEIVRELHYLEKMSDAPEDDPCFNLGSDGIIAWRRVI